MPSDLRSSSGRGQSAVPPRVLSQAWVTDSFKAFGRHCARNQIRVLLIDSFVMTTLFYPALALHLQRRFPVVTDPKTTTSALHSRINAKQHPLSLLSTPILDSVFPEPEPILPYPPSTVFWDLERDEWDAELSARGGTSDWFRQGEVSAVVAVNMAWTSVRRGLSVPAFGGLDLPGSATEDDERLEWYSTQLDDLALRWGSEADRIVGPSNCIRDPTYFSTCFATPSRAVDIETPDVPRPQPVLRPPSIWESRTYYFSRGLGSTSARTAFRDDWVEAVRNLSSSWSAELQSMGSRRATRGEDWLVSPRIRLSGNATRETLGQGQPPARPTLAAIPLPIVFLYLCVIAYIMYCLTEAHQAHSRFGLAFTGVIELACSTIMSFSVMILFGWGGQGSALGGRDAAGVPWYLLPFVVVIVGAENMSAVTRAVYAVPVTYSVPDRLGEALGEVGKSLFVTSVVDILVLVTIRFTVTLRPVQDLCTFAAVLIFVDWWMLHTFYLTVLSIDCQRLDLADLIKQGSKPPSQKKLMMTAGIDKANDRFADSNGRPITASGLRVGFVKSIRSILRARSARGASSLMLLALLTVLYYVNESHQSRALRMVPEVLRAIPTLPTAPDFDSMAIRTASTWRTLSRAISHGQDGGALSIASLPPNMVVIPSTNIPMTPSQLLTFVPPLRNRLIHRLKPLFYLFKVVFLPQAVTAFTLYLLLLFLLKGADHLDPQRDHDQQKERQNRGAWNRGVNSLSGNVDRTASLAADLTITARRTIGRPDIERYSISTTGSVAITRGDGGTMFLTTAAGVFVIRPMGLPWRSADIASDGKHFVIASDKQVFLYQVDELGYASVVTAASLDTSESPVTSISGSVSCQIPSSLEGTSSFDIAVGRRDGTLEFCDAGTAHECTSLAKFPFAKTVSGDLRLACLKRFPGAQRAHAVAIDDHGTAYITTIGPIQAVYALCKARFTENRITAIDICASGASVKAAIGTAAGTIEIWDLETASLCAEVLVSTGEEERKRKIRKIRMISSSEAVCGGCALSRGTKLVVVWSSAHEVGTAIATPDNLTRGTCECLAGKMITPKGSPSTDAYLTPMRGGPTRASTHRRPSIAPVSPPARAAEAESYIETSSGCRNSGGDEVPMDLIARKRWSARSGAWTLLPDHDTLLCIRRSGRTDCRWEALFVDLWSGGGDEGETAVEVQLDPPCRNSLETSSHPPFLSLAEKRERTARAWATRPKQGQPFLTPVDGTYPPLAFSRITEIVNVNPRMVAVVAGNTIIDLKLPEVPLSDRTRSERLSPCPSRPPSPGRAHGGPREIMLPPTPLTPRR